MGYPDGAGPGHPRLRIGTLVTGIHYRHPAVLANMVATLDIVSGGRLELGIGAGWNEEESGAYGIELGSPHERSDRFEEACQVLIGLLSQETTTFTGKYYRLTEARCNPKPVQRPHPPICIGGSGERRTLGPRPGTLSTGILWGARSNEFRAKRDVLLRHCADVGRDPADILISSHVRFEGDPKATAANAANLGDAGVALAIVSLPPPHRPDVLEPLAEALADIG